MVGLGGGAYSGSLLLLLLLGILLYIIISIAAIGSLRVFIKHSTLSKNNKTMIIISFIIGLIVNLLLHS